MITLDKRAQKWIVLALVWLGVFMTTYAQNQLSAMSVTLMADYGFDAQQYSSIYSAPNWVAVFLGIFVGVASDRINLRTLISVSGALCILGMIIRIMTNAYVPFFITGLLTGFVATAVSVNRAKIMGAWFDREQMGLAMGIVMTVTPVASTLAIGTTALLPSLQFAFILTAVISGVFLVLWLLFGKVRPDDAPVVKQESIFKNIKFVAKTPWVWVLAATGFIVLGGSQVPAVAFLPAALQSQGYDAATAGLLSTGVTISMGVGSIVTPLIVRAVGRYRPVIAIYTVLGAISLFFGWQMDSMIALYALLFIAGFVVGSFLPIVFTFPIFLVGQEKVSSATGLISSFQLLGAATLLPNVIIPLTGMDFTSIFAVSAGSLVIGGILLFIIPELGRKGKRYQFEQEQLKQQAEKLDAASTGE